jgi:hypothetical protein
MSKIIGILRAPHEIRELAKPAAKELLAFHALETSLRAKSKSLGQEGGSRNETVSD